MYPSIISPLIFRAMQLYWSQKDRNEEKEIITKRYLHQKAKIFQFLLGNINWSPTTFETKNRLSFSADPKCFHFHHYKEPETESGCNIKEKFRMILGVEFPNNKQPGKTNGILEEEEHSEPALAVLFPPFTLTVGVLVFFVLPRYVKSLPYTAVSSGALQNTTSFCVAHLPNHLL